MDRPHSLWVTLEGGQTVAIDIMLERGSGRKGRADVIQLTYADAATVAAGDSERPVAETIPVGPRPEPAADLRPVR